jgi:integrase
MRDPHEAVTIISNTGIRAGELYSLRWADVDVRRRKLVVNANSFYERSVPFGPKTPQILELRREREPEAEYVL